METMVQDYQFALHVIRREFNINKAPLAAIGRGVGATTGLAWINRNDEVDAFISLERSRHEYVLTQSPYYDSLRMTTPMLLMGMDTTPDRPVRPSLFPFADRYVLNFSTQWSAYNVSLAMWQKHIPGLVSDEGDAAQAFEWVARYALYFLDWHLKQGFHGRHFIQSHPAEHNGPEGLIKFEYWPAAEVPVATRETSPLLRQGYGGQSLLRQGYGGAKPSFAKATAGKAFHR
jgi:hypothetical protein